MWKIQGSRREEPGEIRKQCQVDSKNSKRLPSCWWFAGQFWHSLTCRCVMSISALYVTWHFPHVSLSSRGCLLKRAPVISQGIISKGLIVALHHPMKRSTVTCSTQLTSLGRAIIHYSGKNLGWGSYLSLKQFKFFPQNPVF